jgi:uncharacterized membrane protein YhfC
MKRSIIIVLSLTLLNLSGVLWASTLLEYEGQENPQEDTAYYEFDLVLSENGSRMLMDLRGDLETGELNVWLGGAGYEVIGNYTGEARFDFEKVVFGPLNNTDPIKVKITSSNASGEWQVCFREMTKAGSLLSLLVSGCLVVLVTLVILLWWRRNIEASWKWLLLGAGVWFVGVVFKFIVAMIANTPVLELLESSLGHTGYLALGATYIGLLTGVFEIGITLAFAFLIRGMYKDADRALSIGLGAGLVEALLIGFSSIGNYLTVATGAANSDVIMNALTQAVATTPLLWLVSPIERIIAILCHTSSRILVLYGVMRHKYRYFWAGFLILSAIDVLAGYFHLAGLINKISLWWIELALLPFAALSIPIIIWCYRHWQDRDISSG